MVDLIVKRKAHIYVCGDGRSMAADVHNELVAIIRAELGLNQEEAIALLDNLRVQGRYQKEIWQ